MKKVLYIILAALPLLAACDQNNMVADDIVSPIQPGDEVLFDIQMQTPMVTKALEGETFFPPKEGYDYEFSVEMYQKNGGADQIVGSSKTYVKAEDYNVDGTLQPGANGKLCWPDNVNAYAFKAEANTADIAADQSDFTKWLAQDRLLGYGYEELNAEGNHSPDQVGQLNYHSSKDWYACNLHTYRYSNPSTEDYKKVPLFMEHQRSWITVILMADEGVKREALQYKEDEDNLSATIYSYSGTPEVEFAITEPWRQKELVDYPEDLNGPAVSNYSTTRFDAIVEPHDYSANPEEAIFRIDLSNQKYKFAAQNDKFAAQNDKGYIVNGITYPEVLEKYNLKAGQHLIITAWLTNNHIVLITAWVVDWVDEVANTICDDFGQSGDPIMIYYWKQLEDFLNSDDNKAGNVAVIANDLRDTVSWNPDGKVLKASINMAGSTLGLHTPFVEEIEASGSIANGKFHINADVPYSVAGTSSGNIEYVTISADKGVKASVAGMVEENHGSISYCKTVIPVCGAAGTPYVGGIAATSTSTPEITAIIDQCSVYGKVSGESGVKGAGIVGLADGIVTNNLFEYGITLLQNASDFKNIIYDKSSGSLTASRNAWPTVAENTLAGSDNNYDGIINRAVIDCQAELAALSTAEYNLRDCIYRIEDDFTVVTDADGWAPGDVAFKLNGHNKTITLDAEGDYNRTSLLSHITGEVFDLTVVLKKSLVANTQSGGTDAIAPFAYSVEEEGAKISNIKVKTAGNSLYVQASNPSGLVSWAYNGAVIENCQAKVRIMVKLPAEIGTDSRHYAGGIVAFADRATITKCIYHNQDNTLEGSTNPSVYYGGILGGTVNYESSNPVPTDVVITDCISWYKPHNMNEAGSKIDQKHGAIVGYPLYFRGETSYVGTSDCQGNWWDVTTSFAVGTNKTGLRDSDVIGKCNAVTPTPDTEY